jgi:hypothetical protein
VTIDGRLEEVDFRFLKNEVAPMLHTISIVS